MAVVVTKRGVKVKANGEYHSLGATIHGLPELAEKRLVKGGVCEYVPSVFVPHDSASDDEPLDTEDKQSTENTKIPDDKEEVEDPKVSKSNKSLAGKSKAKNKEVVTSHSEEVGPDTSHPLV